MVIDCRVAKELGGCVYARVFEVRGRAYKLFRKVSDHGSQDEERRKTFLSECNAYERVQQHLELMAHTPVYHGRFSIEGVIDEGGIRIGDNFFLDCCYSMEVLTGPCEKVTLQWWDSDHRLWSLREKFIDAGIYVDDADAFNKDDIDKAKLIDFRAV